MTSYESLYRKYRPQTFAEVVDQAEPLRLLQKVVLEKKPSHAYLFFGGRGVGKTSLARIFAKSLGIQAEDVYELDAASNRGIDEVRELRESVHTLPFSSPYKMYILDEAHMLTKEASNALLKTLEEPPSHVIFILATTDKDKLPDTIHSRCQTIVFNVPKTATLSSHIANTLTEEASNRLAQDAKGSYRDALGLLEKVTRMSDSKTIDHKSIELFLGLSEKDSVHSIIIAMSLQDGKSLFNLTEMAQSQSVSPFSLFDDVLETLRELLLFRIGALTSYDDKKNDIVALQKTLTVPVQSKHLLYLLEKAPLLKRSEETAWTVLFLIFLETFTV
jgi:DNA polymerase-3 subunit gamma/tau